MQQFSAPKITHIQCDITALDRRTNVFEALVETMHEALGANMAIVVAAMASLPEPWPHDWPWERFGHFKLSIDGDDTGEEPGAAKTVLEHISGAKAMGHVTNP